MRDRPSPRHRAGAAGGRRRRSRAFDPAGHGRGAAAAARRRLLRRRLRGDDRAPTRSCISPSGTSSARSISHAHQGAAARAGAWSICATSTIRPTCAAAGFALSSVGRPEPRPLTSTPAERPMSQTGHRFDPTILREYDIRGIVGRDAASAADALRHRPRASARCARRRRRAARCVGYDGRLSSPELERRPDRRARRRRHRGRCASGSARRRCSISPVHGTRRRRRHHDHRARTIRPTTTASR